MVAARAVVPSLLKRYLMRRRFFVSRLFYLNVIREEAKRRSLSVPIIGKAADRCDDGWLCILQRRKLVV
jgi:hypothetical protein